MRLGAAILATLTFSVGAASAQAPSRAVDAAIATGGWRLQISPDQTFSVTLPCNTAETQVRVVGSGYAITCLKGGLLFAVSHGMNSPDPVDGGKPRTFQAFLDSARHDAPDDLKAFNMKGHDGFDVVCPQREGVACLRVVDLEPGKPLIMGAVEYPQNSIPVDQRSQALAMGRKFYDSLDILTK